MAKLYNITDSCNFLQHLAKLVTSNNVDKQNIANDIIFLPTRRAVKELKELLLKQSSGIAILPQIYPISEITKVFQFETNIANKNTISKFERLFTLAKIYEGYKDGNINKLQSIRLASLLGSLKDEIKKANLDIKDIAKLEMSEFAEQWQQTVDFLALLSTQYPAQLEKINKVEEEDNKQLLLDNIAAELVKNSYNKGNIYIAGSTASDKNLALFCKKLLNLDKFHLVLPNLNSKLMAKSKYIVGSSHPQYALQKFVKLLKADVNDIIELTPNYNNLLAENILSDENEDNVESPDLNKIKLFNSNSLLEEAYLMATIIKDKLHNNKQESQNWKIMVVTSNRMLSDYLKSALLVWNIKANDPGGEALIKTSPFIYLQLIAELSLFGFNTVNFMALLKHPLFLCGLKASEIRQISREIEIKLLRNGTIIDSLEGYLAKANNENRQEKRLSLEALDLLTKLQEKFKAISFIKAQKSANFNELLKAHLQLAANLSTNNLEQQILFAQPEYTEIEKYLADLKETTLQERISPEYYSLLFTELAKGQVYRAETATDKNIVILSPQEARFIPADVVIIGDCNEGSFPAAPNFDPYMNNNMRISFGLNSMNASVGRSAHDLEMLLSYKKLYITRSTKVGSSQANTSRFILRIKAFYKKLGQEALLNNQNYYKNWANELFYTQKSNVKAISRPVAYPPTKMRPTSFSVSDISKLMRDPYGFYANKIIKARPLESLEKEESTSAFGNIVHESLKDFIDIYHDLRENEQLPRLISTGEANFTKNSIDIKAKPFWHKRYKNIAKWFVENEKLRRKHEISILAEVNGSTKIQGLNNNVFEVHCRADRLEILNGNTIQIIDYKTGTSPSNSSVEEGLEPQLIIEAFIALKGGFNKCNISSVNSVEYWALKQENHEDIIKLVNSKRINEIIEAVEANILTLLEHYASSTNGFAAIPVAKNAPQYNDYKHLERLGEWDN